MDAPGSKARAVPEPTPEIKDWTMSPIAIEKAQNQLYDLILKLNPGEELVLLAGDTPVAKLARLALDPLTPIKAGSAKGKIWMAPDFDAPLDDFEEYMD
jgi:antitoxin (DNA-binding transcriptional repressor) of toxin-antitoxin stability system